MDLNNIELSDLLITELYRDTLIASQSAPAGTSAAPPQKAATNAPQVAAIAPTGPAPAPSTAPAPGAYKFLGANQKKITVLVQSPGVAFLPDDQLSVLTKMLEACRMNMADVAMVNHAALPVKIAALKQQLAPRIVLLFGLQPVDIELPINFPQFKIQAYDQCIYLYAPSLEEMTGPAEPSKAIKSKLWTCLKTLFEI